MGLFYRDYVSVKILPVKFDKFPNGELLVKEVPHILGRLILKWESDLDLIALLLLKAKVDFSDIDLHILYMPYSRMDRGENSSRCSLRYIASFIKDMGFNSIKVVEPHSDLTLAYLGETSSGIYPFQKIIREPFQKTDIVLFPDAGAAKRYSDIWNGIQLVANKKRDFTTGKILGYNIDNASIVAGKHVTIVDDLCSKGTTFLHAGIALREAKASKVDLVITHCEDTIYQGSLLDPDSPIDHIYTTDSILTNTNNPKITIYNLFTKLF